MALSTQPNNGATVFQSARTVSLSAGQAVLEAARAKARQIGVPMNIAVVDEGSNLAIGVSGGTVEQDQEAAEGGVAAFSPPTPRSWSGPVPL